MKKQFEQPTIFNELLNETRQTDEQFTVSTPDPEPELFADELIAAHYPPQSELPLD